MRRAKLVFGEVTCEAMSIGPVGLIAHRTWFWAPLDPRIGG